MNFFCKTVSMPNPCCRYKTSTNWPAMKQISFNRIQSEPRVISGEGKFFLPDTMQKSVVNTVSYRCWLSSLVIGCGNLVFQCHSQLHHRQFLLFSLDFCPLLWFSEEIFSPMRHVFLTFESIYRKTLYFSACAVNKIFRRRANDLVFLKVSQVSALFTMHTIDYNVQISISPF